MKSDIVITGMRGQGVTSAATILTSAAVGSGLHAVRSELRDVAERDGAVMISLRIADQPFDEKLCGEGPADLVLSLDPLEGVRQIRLLSPASALVTASEPASDVFDPPSLENALWAVLQLRAGYVVEARRLAQEAGGARAANSVLLGAAADFLPIEPERIREAVAAQFAPKGGRAVEVNLAAFDAGRRSLRHRELVDEFDTFSSFSR